MNTNEVSKCVESGTKLRNMKMENRTISTNKHKVSVSIPSSHELNRKLSLSIVKKKAIKYDNLITSLTRTNYDGSGIGNRLFGTVAAMVP